MCNDLFIDCYHLGTIIDRFNCYLGGRQRQQTCTWRLPLARAAVVPADEQPSRLGGQQSRARLQETSRDSDAIITSVQNRNASCNLAR
jgi:hypothetical protein